MAYFVLAATGGKIMRGEFSFIERQLDSKQLTINIHPIKFRGAAFVANSTSLGPLHVVADFGLSA